MKVLFVGLGGVGQRHLRNLKQLLGEDAEIYAFRTKNAQFVLDDRLNIREGLALNEAYKIRNVSSLSQAFKNGVDIVFITNPSSMHMDVLLKASEHGCHIFVEKPLSHNLENLDELMKQLKVNKSITFVGYQNRFHPCIKKAKKMLEQGVIGNIISVNAKIGEDIRTWHKYEDYRKMYAAKKDLGGGVVLTQIHELDYITWFLGMPKSVYALGGKLSELEIDVEDTASILMNYEISGRSIPVHIYQDYIQNPPSRKCEIIGTKGKILFDLLNATIGQYDEDGTEVFFTTFEFERNEMFMEELRSFLHAIGHKKETVIPIEEGIKSLKIAIAIKESMKLGEIIRL